MMKVNLVMIMVLASGALISCSEEVNESTLFSVEKKIVERNVDPIKYSQGARLYQSSCAVCHGNDAQGAKQWRKVDKDGKNPAPPLNGSGHTWHHSNKSLINTIRNGTAKIGGNMPAWKDKLSNSEIKLILTWITAQWPDEIYTAWYNRFHQKQ